MSIEASTGRTVFKLTDHLLIFAKVGVQPVGPTEACETVSARTALPRVGSADHELDGTVIIHD